MDNKIHPVIFDMDGTLVDSAILTMAALKRIAPEHGLPLPSIETIRSAMGNASPVYYYIMFPDSERNMISDIGLLVDEEELQLLPSLCDKLLFEGCRELLIRLKDHGLRLCIASTGKKDHVFPVLNETGITGFFDTIACARPDKTEMLNEMIEGSDKSGYLMVGDMKKDYEAARANGIVSVGACCCKRHVLSPYMCKILSKSRAASIYKSKSDRSRIQ
jgi:phosphoglycolate phosphatase